MGEGSWRQRDRHGGIKRERREALKQPPMGHKEPGASSGTLRRSSAGGEAKPSLL